MSEQESSNSLSFLHYEGHNLRAFMDTHGMVWWVAQDVCQILGILNTSEAVSRLDEDEKGIEKVHTLGGAQDLLTVNESGLYLLIFGSRKSEARAFRRWVTHDVLPQIRHTGTYAMPTRAEVIRSNHLAAHPYPIRERAHISTYLLAVWTTLRQAEDPLSNAEISAKTAMKVATVRKWTRYLLYLGVVDMYETCPEHLFEIPPQADKRHAGYFQRLERLAAMMEQRQRRLFA